MTSQEKLLKDPSLLLHRIIVALYEQNQQELVSLGTDNRQHPIPSSVLLLLGPNCGNAPSNRGPCVILNERSTRVRQPGDLCCPGGGVSERLDPIIAKFLQIPGSPLRRWPYWKIWKHKYPEAAENLRLFLASGLRESFEEMRLNPLGVQFLGPLPLQQLAMFRRDIYPLVCWVPRQNRFRLNWEVEKLVYIPLRNLLDPKNYACYRLSSEIPRRHWNDATENDFPCFVQGSERLWGATYRITMTFLEIVFGFRPPEMGSLPIICGQLDRNYATGNPS